MKIRNDYVSNSSSSSFIINFNDGGKCVDGKFLRLVGLLKDITVSGNCKSKKQLEEFKRRGEALFGKQSMDGCEDYDGNYFSIDFDGSVIDDEQMEAQVEFIRDILALKNSDFYCYGGDDYGEELTRTTQIATLLESRYKPICIQSEDHFDYDTIRGTDLDI